MSRAKRAARSEELARDSVFAGRYRIENEMGRGGMGVVYAAFDTKIERKIALKVIANAEENMTQGFETLRAVLEADDFQSALKIQQAALRETFERNLKQIREVTEMLTSSGQTAFKPLGKLVASFRDTPRKAA